MKTFDETRRNLYKSIYTELEKIAIVQSVKGSNAIEGILTTDERINAIVNQKSEPLNHNEQEIAGYRDTLNLIHIGYSNLAFDGRNILSFHKTLLQAAKPIDAGHYKTEDNVIIEVCQDGTRKVRFTPISKEEKKTAMEQLVLAYLDASTDSEINPLLLIPCVILDFLCIHPFNDGNGRTGRILNVLYLVLQNKLSLPILYLSKYINSTKDEYYKCLHNIRVDDKYIKDYLIYMINGVEYTSNFTLSFISKFKESMDNCKLLLKEKNPKLYSKELVEYLFFDFYTKNEYLRNALSISRNTASKYLSELENIGILTSEQIGKEKIYKNNYLYDLMKEW